MGCQDGVCHLYNEGEMVFGFHFSTVKYIFGNLRDPPPLIFHNLWWSRRWGVCFWEVWVLQSTAIAWSTTSPSHMPLLEIQWYTFGIGWIHVIPCSSPQYLLKKESKFWIFSTCPPVPMCLASPLFLSLIGFFNHNVLLCHVVLLLFFPCWLF